MGDLLEEFHWDSLRFFLAAYEAGSFSLAGEILGVAQATVSRHVKALEDSIDQLLFFRSRDGLTPTPTAISLLPHVEAMHAAAFDALFELTSLEDEILGTVRVAMPPGPAVDLGPPLVLELHKRHPNLRLEILSSNRAFDLGHREADIAVRTVRPTAQSLVFRTLRPMKMGVFVSAETAAKLPKNPGPTDVNWVQFSEELMHLPIAQWVEKQRGTRPPAMMSNSFLVLRQAVAQGVGAMVLPRVQGALLGLVSVPALEKDIADAEIPWFLVSLKALKNVPRIRAVLDLLWEIGVQKDLVQWLQIQASGQKHADDVLFR